MSISAENDFDKNEKKFYGYVTLKDTDEDDRTLGRHLLVALIRGVKSNYKQVIGAHIVDSRIDGKLFKNFMEECIKFVEEVGLTVVAVGSDMGSNNRYIIVSYCLYVLQRNLLLISFQLFR